MKILVLHNHYQHAGGEDTVFESETKMIEAAGHTVIRFEISNNIIEEMNPSSLAIKSVWNFDVCKKIREVIRESHPDIAHFHNTTPLISPAAYWACRAEGIPVVQTLHNYRLTCLGALLYRDRKICENCLGKSLFRGVRHRCYRNSMRASLALALTISFHRWIGTYRKKIDAYIALTQFGREKMIAAYLPPAKIFVKPNTVEMRAESGSAKAERNSQQPLATDEHRYPQIDSQQPISHEGTKARISKGFSLDSDESVECLDLVEDIAAPLLRRADSRGAEEQPKSANPISRISPIGLMGDTAAQPHGNAVPWLQQQPLFLFAGRLSHEKGVDILICAWKLAKLPAGARLVIAGDGPERKTLESLAGADSNIRFVGRLDKENLQRAMHEASVGVLPSVCYEGFPMTLAEGFALGLPAIVSDIGAQAAMVQDGVTGFHFRSGDAQDLARVLEKALADRDRLATMGQAAYEYIASSDSPPDRNIEQLVSIYETIISYAQARQEKTIVVSRYRKVAAWLTAAVAWGYRKVCVRPIGRISPIRLMGETATQPTAAVAAQPHGDTAPWLQEQPIVLFEPYGMGDIVTMLPLLKRLHEAGRETIIFAKSAWQDIVPPEYYREWIPTNLKWTSASSREKYQQPLQLVRDSFALARKYRKLCAGAIGLDPRGDTRSIFFLDFLRCSRIISLDRYMGTNANIPAWSAEIVSTLAGKLRWQIAGELCRALGIEPPSTPPSLPRLTPIAETKRIGLIALAPWAGKNWPAQNWIALATRFKEHGKTPVFFCGPDQKELVPSSEFPIEVAHSVRDWRKMLESCAGIVTLDTGPMHLADAIGIPLVALFGSTALPLWAPSQATSIIIDATSRLPNMPCHQIDKNIASAQKAMQTISVEEVWESSVLFC